MWVILVYIASWYRSPVLLTLILRYQCTIHTNTPRFFYIDSYFFNASLSFRIWRTQRTNYRQGGRVKVLAGVRQDDISYTGNICLVTEHYCMGVSNWRVSQQDNNFPLPLVPLIYFSFSLSLSLTPFRLICTFQLPYKLLQKKLQPVSILSSLVQRTCIILCSRLAAFFSFQYIYIHVFVFSSKLSVYLSVSEKWAACLIHYPNKPSPC